MHQSDTEKKADFELNTIEEAIADIKAGKVIIVMDDEDRENEGDFVCAAECITPEIINFMATHGRGLICSPITAKRAEELDLDMMVSRNTDLHGTAFTVSVDYKLGGCTTGISAYDRATGIKALIDPNTKPNDYARPGHIFPLVAKSGGVLRRTGHTEATIDLAQLAGFAPAGVLVEILNEDGTMARFPQLMKIAEKFDLKIITIKDLVAYRMERERLVEKDVSVNFETPYGAFEIIAFKETNSNLTHLAIKKGTWEKDEPVLLRVHSSSNSGDVLGALLQGYGEQMQKTLKMIADEGKGLFLFLRQKEEEDALVETLMALKKQQEKGERINPSKLRSSDTRQKELGIGAQIIHDLDIRKIRLITNNPKRRVGLIGYGIEIIENVPIG